MPCLALTGNATFSPPPSLRPCYRQYDNYVQTEKYMLRLPQGKYEKW